ncbi:MAG: MarR family winged helix-turn-helix transcriptional regulator [Burkholderiales bacterium]|nr:MarR family winged helix-turn-helix transcriptional regulator [Burkholderiales bacterium]
MARAPATAAQDTASLPTPEVDAAAPGKLDTSFLETLIGYNARRAALTIIGTFMERMAVYGVRPVDFSVLSVIAHNPGITSRQLCACLGLLPPNLVIMLNQLEQREWVVRQPHPHDGRAIALSLSAQGAAMMAQAEATAYQLEIDATAALTDAQRTTLKRLLKLVYAPPLKTPAAARKHKPVARPKPADPGGSV